MNIILASSSPRRQEMLHDLGLQFDIALPDIPEQRLPGEHADAFVKRIASDKAHAVYRQNHPQHGDSESLLIISGDTAVVVDDRILGKPEDADDAREMLNALSGREHLVMTGMCLLRIQHEQVDHEELFVVKTAVQFKALTPHEIDTYIASGDPFDKAGAYGIQSGAAYMIPAIHGSYTNVVGMPLTELIEKLQNLGAL